MSRYGLLSIAGACALALGSLSTQAQVSVNAPSGLTQRSVTKKPATQQPQTQNDAAKATHEAAPHKEQAADHQASSQRQPKASEAASRSSQSSDISSSATTRSTRASSATGYRIQAYTANNAQTARSNATSRARAIAMKFPQYRTYITYKAPSWRLRIGDFTTQQAAQTALNSMKKAFPGYALTIVRDRINVWR